MTPWSPSCYKQSIMEAVKTKDPFLSNKHNKKNGPNYSLQQQIIP